MTTDAADEIVTATHSALRKRGYAESTMQDIADEAFVSRAGSFVAGEKPVVTSE